MKPFGKLYILAMGMALLGLGSCTQEGDDVGDAKDNFLNFEIPTIKANHEYPVGAYYINPGMNGFDANRYERMMEEQNYSEGKTGPNVDLQLGNYALQCDTSNLTDEMVDIMQQQVDWALEGGVDFFILPSVQPNLRAVYPNCIAGGEQLAYAFMGKNSSWKQGTGKTVDMKNLKFVLTADMSGPLADGSANILDADSNVVGMTKKLDNKTLLDDNDNIVTCQDGKTYTRSEMYVQFFCSLKQFFDDPHYYKVDGTKPLVVLQNAHYLYVSDCQAFYDSIRTAVKERTGYDMYLVARQDAWSPPARFEYFYKGVDAITHSNMYQNGEWTRSLDYPQVIYRNYEYSREYWMNNWNGTDFIPSTPVAWNHYIDDGRSNQPNVEENPETFRTMCNVSKAQAGTHSIIFIDSWNDIQYGSFIEPTKTNYGKGLGDAFLKVCKEEFDVQ